MFELSWGEIVLIGVVALIVIGPKELPGLLRGMGQALAKLRRMASDFQYQFNQALQEAEVDKVKSSITSVTDSVSASSSFNPIDYARDQIKSAVDDVKGAVGAAPPPPGTIGPPAPDPLGAAIPAPPTYVADPAAVQSAFRPAPPPAPFAAAAKAGPPVAAAEPAAIEESVSPPAADAAPAEPPQPAEPAKPKRSRKAAAEPPAEPSAGGGGPAEAPKRSRKSKA